MSKLTSGVRELAAAVIRFGGLPWLIRAMVARGRVTIVVYHDPAAEILDKHLAYLTARYQPITLDLLADALHTRDWSNIPQHALVVTVDDGHKGNSRLGTIFAKYGVVPTIFLCSQIVGTRRAFWFEKCEHSVAQSLKRLPNAERLCELAKTYAFSQTSEYSEYTALSTADLVAMTPQVDFGAHTRFHPILTMCDAAECELEIRGSREDLEARLGKACRHFAYPNGDYADREIDMLRRAGFDTGRATDVGWNGPKSDPFRLRVTGVTDNASINMLAVQVTGIVAYLRCVLAGNWRGMTRKHLIGGA